jgi:hypothetical protein
MTKIMFHVEHSRKGTDMSTTLDCGHEPTPDATAPGYAQHPTTGRTSCNSCADAQEREAITTANQYTGYVTGLRPDVFTTYTGAVLGTVTSQRYGKKRYTPTGGRYRIRYVSVRTSDDAQWHGKGSDAHDVITIRRLADRTPTDRRP